MLTADQIIEGRASVGMLEFTDVLCLETDVVGSIEALKVLVTEAGVEGAVHKHLQQHTPQS